MIDTKMVNLVNQSLPQFNPYVQEGIAKIQSVYYENYIHEIFKCASESFPPGLKYHGERSRRCTPMEQYKEITRQLKPKRMYELLRSDVYLMQYHFTFTDKEGITRDIKPQYLFLPFVSEGGLFYIKGTQYLITPVLGGKVFNIEGQNLYLPIPRARNLLFTCVNLSCYKNDQVIHVAGVWSYLYNMTKQQRSPLKPLLIHYILAQYGLTTTLKQFFNVSVIIGKEELDQLDKEDYLVYRSRQLPIGRKANVMVTTDIRLAIKKEEHYKIMDSIMASIFYIIEQCADCIEVDELDNPRSWLLILDRFIFSKYEVNSQRFEKADDHLQNVINMFDPAIEKILKSDNIHCHTIFELFQYVCLNYFDIIIHNDVGSMYNKEISTVKHLLYDIVYSIFSLMYKLRKIPEHLLSVERINKVFTDTIKKNMIYGITQHGEVNSISIATDCILYSNCCNIMSHYDAVVSGRNKRAKKVVTNPELLFQASQVEVATYQWISKRGPTGRDKLSPFVELTSDFYTTPKKQLQPTIEELRKMLPKR